MLPPQPRPPFRVVVVGPTASGKSTVTRLLAEQYGARVIDLVGMLQEEYNSVLAKRLADVETETQAKVIAEVKERYLQEMKTLRESEFRRLVFHHLGLRITTDRVLLKHKSIYI